MKKYKRFNKGLILGSIIIMVIVICDYSDSQIIPNFIFLDAFSIEYVTAYWMGIGGIVVVIPSIINLILIRMEQVANEYNNQIIHEKEDMLVVKRNLDSAIETLSSENSEALCLTAVRAIEEAIDRQIFNNNNSMSYLGILLAEDLIVLLSDYLHNQLKNRDTCARSEVKYLFRYLFSTFHIRDYCKGKKIAIENFTNEYITIGALTEYNRYTFNKAVFENVHFISEENRSLTSQFTFENSVYFKRCMFEGSCGLYIDKHVTCQIENSIFDGRLEFRSNEEKLNVNVNSCYFNGFTNFSNSKFDTLTFNDCIFNTNSNFSDISASVFSLKNCAFNDFFNFQQTRIQSKLSLSNLFFYNDFTFFGTIVAERRNVEIYNLKVEESPSGYRDFNAKIEEDNREYKLSDGMQISKEEEKFKEYYFDTNI